MLENKTKATLPKSRNASVARTNSLNSSLIRHLWSIVEETQTNILLSFSDTELVHQLLGQMEFRGLLDTEESNVASAYLYSRLLLIRDLAKARLA
jgi:muconolactone delta-isomerase